MTSTIAAGSGYPARDEDPVKSFADENAAHFCLT
jgi:hypothetical protein